MAYLLSHGMPLFFLAKLLVDTPNSLQLVRLNNTDESCYTHCAPLERRHFPYHRSIDMSLLWSERQNSSTLKRTDRFSTLATCVFLRCTTLLLAELLKCRCYHVSLEQFFTNERLLRTCFKKGMK